MRMGMVPPKPTPDKKINIQRFGRRVISVLLVRKSASLPLFSPVNTGVVVILKISWSQALIYSGRSGLEVERDSQELRVLLHRIIFKLWLNISNIKISTLTIFLKDYFKRIVLGSQQI